MQITSIFWPIMAWLQANPLLAQLLTDTVGPTWITALEALQALEPFAKDIWQIASIPEGSSARELPP